MVVMTSQDGQHKCDARCYDAKWFACSCVCGGKNHGKGLGHAINHNTLSGKSLVEFATNEMRKDALITSEHDLSIYGDTPSEQAEGLRFELEHKK